MISLFEQDGLIYRFFDWFASIMICNVCFILGCLPIITMGASLTALYTVLFKIRAGESPAVINLFWNSYKENFKQSTFIWLIILGLGFWFIFCIILFSGSSNRLFQAYSILMIIMLLVLLIFMMYIFPVISQFTNSTKRLIQNSFILMIRHSLTTFTIAMLLLTVLLLIFYNSFTFAWGIGFFISFGFALINYWVSAYLEKIFDRYIIENKVY